MPKMQLDIPNTNDSLYPGNIVKLGRFSDGMWIVSYGWYTWGGNRPVCGWYLTNTDCADIVKPIQLPDLYDIILIEG